MRIQRYGIVVVAVVLGVAGCGRKAKRDGDGGATSTSSAATRPMSPAEAQQHFADAIAEFGKPPTQRSCSKVATSWSLGYRAHPADSPALRSATLAAARCCEIMGDWPHLAIVGKVLAKMDPTSEKYAFVPRALLSQHDDKDALGMLDDIDKRMPNQPEVLYTKSLVHLQDRAWAPLIKEADATTAAVAASQDPETKSFRWRAQLMRETGDWYLGKLADAESDIAAAQKSGAPAAFVDERRKELVPFKQNKIGVDVERPLKLYLGTYHLRGRVPELGNFMSLSFVNATGKDQVLTAEVEIPGVTDKITKSHTVLKGRNDLVYLTPTLRADFSPQAQTAERTASVSVKVTTADGKVVFDDSSPVTVYPRDQFPRAEEGSNVIAAWVTPQAPAVEDFIASAKKRAEGGKLDGSYAATLPQVKVIYDELHARGMTYVLQTDFGYGSAQHVRLPVDSIRSTNALCLDGAVLFATLMEKIGLHPIVVFVPGHAFVGWHAEAADKQAPNTIYWLETTMVGDAPFEAAVERAGVEFKKHSANDATQLIDIAAVRARGFTAQPWN
jgi:hypothetical protein